MEWRYESSQDLEKSLVERLRSFPREPEMLVYAARSMAALATRVWLRVYHRLEIVGRENLPASGSFVLVANHASHLDTLALLAALPLRRLHCAFPAAAQDYFFVSVPRLAISAVLVNAMPFSRQVHSRHSLSMCRALLQNHGNILILYPEGTRTTTGNLGDFRSGVGAVVAGSGIPVIPCALAGTYRAWPKGNWFPKPKRITLVIGQSRTFDDLSSGKASHERVAGILHAAVKELLT